jgi:hypothetical protein
VKVVKQDLLQKNHFLIFFMKCGLKEVISIDADSGPPRYEIWWCGGICHQPDTFIQIGSGHNVYGNKNSV